MKTTHIKRFHPQAWKSTTSTITRYLLISAATLLTSLPAQAALMVNGELTHEYQTTAGQRLSGTVEVVNNGDEPLDVRVFMEDAAPNGQRQPHAASNLRWVHLNQDRLQLPPHGRQQLAYTLAAPPQSHDGTYWSTLNVEPVNASDRDAGARQTDQGTVAFAVKQKLRYSINVMTHIGQGSGQIKFQQPSMTTDAHGQRALEMHLLNSGQFHSKLQTSVQVFDARGNSLGVWKGSQRGLYPGMTKTFTTSLTGLKPGKYKTLLMAEDLKSGRTFGADLDLNIR